MTHNDFLLVPGSNQVVDSLLQHVEAVVYAVEAMVDGVEAMVDGVEAMVDGVEAGVHIVSEFPKGSIKLLQCELEWSLCRMGLVLLTPHLLGREGRWR